MIKEKQCKSMGKAQGFQGCGKLTQFRKFGLCSSCYPKWLYTTDVGKLEIEQYFLKNNIMSIKVDNFNKLVEKAKNKKDGVYSMAPYKYVVKNGCFIAYSDYSGNCYRAVYGFTTFIGKVERYDIVKKLKEFLNAQ